MLIVQMRALREMYRLHISVVHIYLWVWFWHDAKNVLEVAYSPFSAAAKSNFIHDNEN